MCFNSLGYFCEFVFLVVVSSVVVRGVRRRRRPSSSPVVSTQSDAILYQFTFFSFFIKLTAAATRASTQGVMSDNTHSRQKPNQPPENVAQRSVQKRDGAGSDSAANVTPRSSLGPEECVPSHMADTKEAERGTAGSANVEYQLGYFATLHRLSRSKCTRSTGIWTCINWRASPGFVHLHFVQGYPAIATTASTKLVCCIATSMTQAAPRLLPMTTILLRVCRVTHRKNARSWIKDGGVRTL